MSFYACMCLRGVLFLEPAKYAYFFPILLRVCIFTGAYRVKYNG